MQTTSEHDYVVEVHREDDGALLAQEVLDELGHLVDEARYLAVSEGGVPDEPGYLSARLEPVTGAADGRYLEGVRVHLYHERLPELDLALEFSRDLAGPAGTELAARLITEGRLQQGDRYRVRLAAVPRPPRGAAERRMALASLVRREEQPFPVLRRGLDSWGITARALEAADARRPVFIAADLVAQAIEEAVRHFNNETGTLLLGHLVEDPQLLEAGKETAWAVVVTGQAPVTGGEGTTTSFTFPPESFRQARRLAELRGQGERVVGSQHSHGWRCRECDKACEIRNLFFSTDDVRMAALFPVYAAFLVVGGDPGRDRDRPVASLYLRYHGVMQAVPFGTFG